MKSTLQSITATWKQFAPDQPIRYKFLDESYASMYADVTRMGHIFTTFAILAIIIACLGLFALSAFMAEQRSKEIGIRKVLGASVQGITTMLSRDFVKLVLLAFVLAAGISAWYVRRWLDQYTYHTSFNGWIFVLTLVGSIGLCVAAVGWQAFQAARANPVKSLRSE